MGNPRRGRAGPGWAASETGRFGRLACRLWDPLLAHETGPVVLDDGPRGPTPEPFDVCGALPAPGITVLEASAGTGKTFTISALVTRFVAGRSAARATSWPSPSPGWPRASCVTGSGAVWSRPQTGLARNLLAGEPVPADDEVAAYLAKGAEPTSRPARPRLADAVAGVRLRHHRHDPRLLPAGLDGLGSAGRRGRRRHPARGPGDLIEEVVDDLYLRWCLRHGAPAFHRGTRRRIAAAAAVANPGVAARRPAGRRRGCTRLVAKAPHEVARRLQDDNLLTYDHLLSRLAGHPGRPGRGDRWPAGACASATGWCWSTSSRTPTRCSGGSCARPSATGHDHPGARRRSQAGHLLVPGRRRPRLP